MQSGPQTVPQICDNSGTNLARGQCPCYSKYHPFSNRKVFQTKSMNLEHLIECNTKRTYTTFVPWVAASTCGLPLNHMELSMLHETQFTYSKLDFPLLYEFFSQLVISDPPKPWNRKDWPVWVALGITNFKNSRISNWLKLYWRVCKVRPCRWHISVCTHWPWTVLAVQLGTRTTLRMLRPRIAALQQGAASNSIKAH